MTPPNYGKIRQAEGEGAAKGGGDGGSMTGKEGCAGAEIRREGRRESGFGVGG